MPVDGPDDSGGMEIRATESKRHTSALLGGRAKFGVAANCGCYPPKPSDGIADILVYKNGMPRSTYLLFIYAAHDCLGTKHRSIIARNSGRSGRLQMTLRWAAPRASEVQSREGAMRQPRGQRRNVNLGD